MSQADPTGRERLAVALDATPLLGMRSGVGMFCQGAIEALAARPGLEVAGFAVTWRRRHRLTPLVPAGVRVVSRPMPARPLHRLWRRRYFPAIEWFIGPVDVVHGTNFVVPPTRRAARVVTVHDLTAVRFPALCDASTRQFPALVRRAVAEGAWVHTPSQFVADEVVAEFGIAAEKVRVVHHGIPGHAPGPPPAGPASEEPASEEPASEEPATSERSVRRALPEGTARYILAVGTVEPRKDLPGLVAAFDQLADDQKDVALVLAGAAGWGDDALAGAMARSAHRGRILRLGYVADEDLQGLLAGAAVLAYPSVYEGFGFPPLEAMAVGVPVVATAVGAIPEVTGDGALLVAPGDVEALAGGLSTVLSGGERVSALIGRGRARAEEFSWEKCGEGLDALYRDAAAAR